MSYALPGAVRQPYSPGSLPYTPTDPRRIALSLYRSASLRKQLLDQSGYLLILRSLAVHRSIVLRPTHSANLYHCVQSRAQASEMFPESSPKSVEAHPSSSIQIQIQSRRRRSRVENVSTHIHCARIIVVSSHAVLYPVRSMLSPSDHRAQKRLRRAALVVLTCALAKLDIRRYCASNRKMREGR